MFEDSPLAARKSWNGSPERSHSSTSTRRRNGSVELDLAGQRLLAHQLGVEPARRLRLEDREAAALEQRAERGGWK